MAADPHIPAYTIRETLAQGHQPWHAQDYFISAEEPLVTGSGLFRPDYYALFLCVEGHLTAQVNGREIRIGPFCFSAAGPETAIRVSEVSADCKGRYLFFTRAFLLDRIISPALLEAFYYLSEQVGCCLQLSAGEAAALLQLYDILAGKRDEDDSAYHTEIIRSLFFTFLYQAAAIFKSQPGGLPYQPGRNQDIHQKFSELLVIHDREQHYLKFYADALFITPQHLIHAIKTACGKTPGALIDEALVAEARLLLSDRGLSIGRVALELHFSDQAAFSKFFKKQTGSTPAGYRRGLHSVQ